MVSARLFLQPVLFKNPTSKLHALRSRLSRSMLDAIMRSERFARSIQALLLLSAARNKLYRTVGTYQDKNSSRAAVLAHHVGLGILGR